ncbi:MAG: type II toxin-antitoxin system HicB family antitoxin [Trebonia sp.]
MLILVTVVALTLVVALVLFAVLIALGGLTLGVRPPAEGKPLKVNLTARATATTMRPRASRDNQPLEHLRGSMSNHNPQTRQPGSTHRRTTESPVSGAAPLTSADDYLILVQRGPTNWGAWSPDLSECVAMSESKDATVSLMRNTITQHLADIASHGGRPPTPSGRGVYVEEHAITVHWVVL